MSEEKIAQRPCIVAGNWKMHMLISQAESYIQQLLELVGGMDGPLYLAVPATAIAAAARATADAPLLIGGQNMHYAPSGAYTGEVSSDMLLEAGARFVLLGHSERRQLFGEDDKMINRKVHRALEAGLQPIVCCGETWEQRERRETAAILEEQLSKSLEGVLPEQMRALIIAYEPVWAIGSGRVATAEQAQETHRHIRGHIARVWGQQVAETVILQYGGSVKPSNVAEIVAQPDVDGVLVGGASLEPASFAAIARSCLVDLANEQK